MRYPELHGDFHTHTIYSKRLMPYDAHSTPIQNVLATKEKNLDFIGITDHDTVEGVEKAVEAGKR